MAGNPKPWGRRERRGHGGIALWEHQHWLRQRESPQETTGAQRARAGGRRGGGSQRKLPGAEAREGFPPEHAVRPLGLEEMQMVGGGRGFPAAPAPQSCPRPRTHLFQSVRCSFNDLREVLVILSDDILQHVCRRGGVGKAPGLSSSHRATAFPSALLRGAHSGPHTVPMEPSARPDLCVCGEERASGGRPTGQGGGSGEGQSSGRGQRPPT